MRVVIVTGGTSGIGRATALAFAALGDAVIVAGRNVERGKSVSEECHQVGGTGFFVESDVTDPTSSSTVVAAALDRYGCLDVACNNAGWQEPRRLLADQPTNIYDRVFNTNVREVVHAMSAQISAMRQRGSGVIVNVGSVSGSRNPNSGLALYSASKAAVASLTRSAAMEYGPFGIRVNLVSPGRIVTPMMMAAGIADREGIAASLPARRMGDPEDVARAIVWLASADAAFVYGAELRVDGGFGAT